MKSIFRFLFLSLGTTALAPSGVAFAQAQCKSSEWNDKAGKVKENDDKAKKEQQNADDSVQNAGNGLMDLTNTQDTVANANYALGIGNQCIGDASQAKSKADECKTDAKKGQEESEKLKAQMFNDLTQMASDIQKQVAAAPAAQRAELAQKLAVDFKNCNDKAQEVSDKLAKGDESLDKSLAKESKACENLNQGASQLTRQCDDVIAHAQQMLNVTPGSPGSGHNPADDSYANSPTAPASDPFGGFGYKPGSETAPNYATPAPAEVASTPTPESAAPAVSAPSAETTPVTPNLASPPKTEPLNTAIAQSAGTPISENTSAVKDAAQLGGSSSVNAPATGISESVSASGGFTPEGGPATNNGFAENPFGALAAPVIEKINNPILANAPQPQVFGAPALPPVSADGPTPNLLPIDSPKTPAQITAAPAQPAAENSFIPNFQSLLASFSPAVSNPPTDSAPADSLTTSVNPDSKTLTTSDSQTDSRAPSSVDGGEISLTQPISDDNSLAKFDAASKDQKEANEKIATADKILNDEKSTPEQKAAAALKRNMASEVANNAKEELGTLVPPTEVSITTTVEKVGNVGKKLASLFRGDDDDTGSIIEKVFSDPRST